MNITLRTNIDKTDKGFTLIEVLMALAIFSIGILAVASLQVTASLQSRNSSEIADATAIAYSQMEELMQLQFLHPNLDPASNPHLLSSGKYSIRWEVTASDLSIVADAINESKTVELTVSWPGSNQREVRFVFVKHDDA